MLTTQSGDLDALSRSLRDYGASRSDHERHTGKAGFLLSEYNLLGFNYRMTDIQGALGSVQMDRVESILKTRTRLARRYDDMLSEAEWLETPMVAGGYTHGYQAYVCLFRPEEPTLDNVDRLNDRRNELMLRLESEGIATRQGTHSPILTGFYANKYSILPDDFPQSYLADRLSLALPLFPQMTEDDQSLVVSRMLQIYGELANG